MKKETILEIIKETDGENSKVFVSIPEGVKVTIQDTFYSVYALINSICTANPNKLFTDVLEELNMVHATSLKEEVVPSGEAGKDTENKN